MAQFAEHQLDHDGIVEQADAGNLVRDDVLRVADVGEGREHGAALVLVEDPVGSVSIASSVSSLTRRSVTKSGRSDAFQRRDEIDCRSEDLLVVGDLH